MGKRTYIRRVGAVLACLILTIELVCTSYTRVQAAEVVAGYTIEQIVGALLVSLGITSATGEALDKAGLTGTDATKILNSIYASAKEFSHDTDEMIDRTIMGAIADATETGKIIFKEGSKAWDAIKDWAKTSYNNIKAMERVGSEGSSVPSSVTVVGTDSATMKSVIANYYGISASSVNISNVPLFNDNMLKLGTLMIAISVLNGVVYVSYVMKSGYESGGSDVNVINNLANGVLSGHYYVVSSDGTLRSPTDEEYTQNYYQNTASVIWTNYTVAGQTWIDGVTLPSVLNPSLDSAYDLVYNPAVDDFLDIATPTNTITEEKDGTRTIAGDRTIDVALPIAWPIDLTKGIVIGKDTPIEDVLDRTKTDEKTDDKKDDKEEEDKPPITPDLPSGTVGDNLEADLKSIFPFCIPFDLIACIKGLAADPEAPVWNIKIPMPWVDYTWTITVDMGDYESVVKIFRIGEDLLFIVGLIVVTRNLIRG